MNLAEDYNEEDLVLDNCRLVVRGCRSFVCLNVLGDWNDTEDQSVNPLTFPFLKTD